nr:unnamed protein product [Callosobruchus analis]
MVDYYKTLNVSSNATTDEIKRAYKQLALQWHPDKNLDNAEEANMIFREITKAYEILSDENSRRKYDFCGTKLNPKWTSSEGRFNRRRHHPVRDPDDIFREFFRGSMFEFYTNLSQRRKQRSPSPRASTGRERFYFKAFKRRAGEFSQLPLTRKVTTK